MKFVLLMVMVGWHASPNVEDRREPEPIVPTFVKPEPPQIEMQPQGWQQSIPFTYPAKPVKTIRIRP